MTRMPSLPSSPLKDFLHFRGQSTAGAGVRLSCRNGVLKGHTSGLASGVVQANLVILPRSEAIYFAAFAQRNPRACPLLAMTEPGNPEPSLIAPGSDVRTDVPQYHVFRDGLLSSKETNIEHLWSEDMVAFLLGCSFTWETALCQSDPDLEPLNVTLGSNVPMYETGIPNVKAGPFGGNLVVSMRPYRLSQLKQVVDITGRYPLAHGGPIHWGEPEALGIQSSKVFGSEARPDWGDAVPLTNEYSQGDMDDPVVPVFWACGVTPQSAIVNARVPLAITHAPGCMFVTDLLDSELIV